MAGKNWVELIGEPHPLPNANEVAGPTPEEFEQWRLEQLPTLPIIFPEGEIEELHLTICPILRHTT